MYFFKKKSSAKINIIQFSIDIIANFLVILYKSTDTTKYYEYDTNLTDVQTSAKKLWFLRIFIFLYLHNEFQNQFVNLKHISCFNKKNVPSSVLQSKNNLFVLMTLMKFLFIFGLFHCNSFNSLLTIKSQVCVTNTPFVTQTLCNNKIKCI